MRLMRVAMRGVDERTGHTPSPTLTASGLCTVPYRLRARLEYQPSNHVPHCSARARPVWTAITA